MSHHKPMPEDPYEELHRAMAEFGKTMEEELFEPILRFIQGVINNFRGKGLE
jgi:ABC-type transporter lipoprotein component MlaA